MLELVWHIKNLPPNQKSVHSQITFFILRSFLFFSFFSFFFFFFFFFFLIFFFFFFFFSFPFLFRVFSFSFFQAKKKKRKKKNFFFFLFWAAILDEHDWKNWSMKEVKLWGESVLKDKDSAEAFAALKFEGVDLPKIKEPVLKEAGIPVGRRMALLRGLDGFSSFISFLIFFLLQILFVFLRFVFS